MKEPRKKTNVLVVSENENDLGTPFVAVEFSQEDSDLAFEETAVTLNDVLSSNSEDAI